MKPKRIKLPRHPVINCQGQRYNWPIALIAGQSTESSRVNKVAGNIFQVADKCICFNRMTIVKLKTVIEMIPVDGSYGNKDDE